jgi:histidinol-phosphate aminotransferase
MCDFLSLAAPGVRDLHPYQPGKPIEELQREYGVSEIIKLASNENALGPSPKVKAALMEELDELARYPDGDGFALKQALMAMHGVEKDCITLGNGSNDVLELIARAFVTAEDEVVFSQHAFAVYPIVTQAVGARAVVTNAQAWGHDLDAMSAAITPRTRVVFIANPNNPTGTWVDGHALETFIASAPKHVLVVVDEAYTEFARALAGVRQEDFPDATRWLAKYPNLIVTRTFSKAYGLAGLRVGYALSHPQAANMLNRVRQPFNVNSQALTSARVALADKEHVAKGVDLNTREMARVTQTFGGMGLDFIPSVGNFVSVDVGREAADVYDALLHEGVIVRPVANYGMPNHLRVSLGLEAENTRFLAALGKVLD